MNDWGENEDTRHSLLDATFARHPPQCPALMGGNTVFDRLQKEQRSCSTNALCDGAILSFSPLPINTSVHALGELCLNQ